MINHLGFQYSLNSLRVKLELYAITNNLIYTYFLNNSANSYPIYNTSSYSSTSFEKKAHGNLISALANVLH